MMARLGRVIMLSAAPARVLAQVPIENPRSARLTEKVAAIREKIASSFAQA